MADLQMKGSAFQQARAMLVADIERWFEYAAAEDIPLPWIGNNAAEIMADAALAVLRGMDDAQKLLIEDGLMQD